MTCQSSWS